MATTFTATVNVQCWKEHRCTACDAVYRYRFIKKVTGSGGTEAAAHAAANKALLHTLAHQVEPRPCPTCGLMQADMIGNWRAAKHSLIATLAVIALAAMAVFGLFDFNKQMLLWITLALAAVVLLAHFFVATSPFNGNLEANREDSVGRLDDGDMQIVSQGRGDSGGMSPAEVTASVSESSVLVIFALMLLFTAAVPAAEVVRAIQGWPWNPAWLPSVAGPGDQLTFSFPRSFKCVKSIWNGVPAAQVVNADELKIPNEPLRADTHTDEILPTISAKSSETNSTVTPWMRIVVPSVPEPRGKKLVVKLDLAVSYPQMDGANRFQVVRDSFSYTKELLLADPGAGDLYAKLFWFCGIGGFGLATLAGCVLIWRARGFIQRAHPTSVHPMNGPAD